MVLGICGSLVWRTCWLRLSSLPMERVLDPALLPPNVLSFDWALFLEPVLLGVLRVLEGLSMGPLLLSTVPAGGRGSLRLSHACLKAELGVILVLGSHSRHLRMKSRKSGSSQPFKAVWSSREPGGPRGFPRRDRPPFKTVVPSGKVVAVQYLG